MVTAADLERTCEDKLLRVASEPKFKTQRGEEAGVRINKSFIAEQKGWDVSID